MRIGYPGCLGALARDGALAQAVAPKLSVLGPLPAKRRRKLMGALEFPDALGCAGRRYSRADGRRGCGDVGARPRGSV